MLKVKDSYSLLASMTQEREQLQNNNESASIVNIIGQTSLDINGIEIDLFVVERDSLS